MKITSQYFRGMALGECLYLPNSVMYVSIPKNASTFLRGKLDESGFQTGNYHDMERYSGPTLAVVRDPLERWVAGMTEYLYLSRRWHQYADSSKDRSLLHALIFDTVNFDPHTQKQVAFLHGLDTNDITAILYDKKTFGSTVSRYFEQRWNLPNNWYASVHIYSRSEDPEKLKFSQELETVLMNNEVFINRIKKYYKEDYDLLEKLDFYQ